MTSDSHSLHHLGATIKGGTVETPLKYQPFVHIDSFVRRMFVVAFICSLNVKTLSVGFLESTTKARPDLSTWTLDV